MKLKLTFFVSLKYLFARDRLTLLKRLTSCIVSKVLAEPNDPRNHTNEHEITCSCYFVYFRGSFPLVVRQTLKELRCVLFREPRRNSFRVAWRTNEIPFPGLPERNPGLKLANAFSVFSGKDVRRPSGVFNCFELTIRLVLPLKVHPDIRRQLERGSAHE